MSRARTAKASTAQDNAKGGKKPPQALAEIERLRELLLKNERKDLAEMRREIARFEDRIGTDAAFTDAVEPILIDALARVQASRGRDLNRTLAPLVVSTIRTELRNSKDDMVNAMYPLMGKMVSASMRASLAKLSEDINRRIDAASNPQVLWAKTKAKLTGKPVNTYMVAGDEPAKILRAILIQRDSGMVVAHWTEDEDETGDADLVSGLIAALSSFTSQTYAHRQGELKNIDLEGHNLALRHSPSYLLALDIEGDLTRPQQERVDALFFDLMEQVETGEEAPDDLTMQDLAGEISSAAAERKRSALKPILILLLLAGLAFVGYRQWTIWNFDRQIEAVSNLLKADGDLSPYPLEVTGHTQAKSIVVSGLVSPDFDVDALALQAQTEVHPDTEVIFNVRNISTQDRNQAIATRMRSDAERVSVLLTSLQNQLDALSTQTANSSNRLSTDLSAQIQASQAQMQERMDQFESATKAAAAQQADAANAALAQQAQRAADIQAGLDTQSRLLTDLQAKLQQQSISLSQRMEQSATTLSSETTSLAAQLEKTRSSLTNTGEAVEQLGRQIVDIGTQSARNAEALEAREALSTAAEIATLENLEIAFATNSTLRDPKAANADLKLAAAALLRLNRPTKILGHGDISGSEDANLTSSLARAQLVRSRLIALGVKQEMLFVEGRGNQDSRSSLVGLDSPERRVTFKVER